MTVPVISTAPTAPARTQDPDTYSANADAFIAYIEGLSAQLNAYASALQELASFSSYSATSTSSVAIGTGDKTFTIEAGKLYNAGQSVVVANTATPTNNMVGTVKSYNSVTGALVVTVAQVSGSGTFSAWTVSLTPAVDAATLYASMQDLIDDDRDAAIATAIAGLIDSSPGALDTLNELAAALGDDPNFATTMTNALAAKLSLAGGTMTGLITIAAAVGMRLTPGSDPASLVNGLIWANTEALKARLNGTTHEVALLAKAQTLQQKTLESPVFEGMVSGGGLATNMTTSQSGKLLLQSMAKSYIDSEVLAAKNAGFTSGQTWQDVKASRAANTSYQNTTSKPIKVAISVNTGNDRYFQVSSNGTDWINVGFFNDNRGIGLQTSVSEIVPVNWYYRISGGVSSIDYWTELR